MKKNAAKALFVVILFFLAGSAFAETGVLSPDDAKPKQVVLARKFVKNTLFANFKELQGKMKAGNITGISVNAKTIAALASLLPLVFKETYTEVYPISGSKYYYKGGSLSRFVQAAQNLFDQAETLAKLSESNDTSGVEAQMSKLFDNCKACHSTYRGTN